MPLPRPAAAQASAQRSEPGRRGSGSVGIAACLGCSSQGLTTVSTDQEGKPRGKTEVWVRSRGAEKQRPAGWWRGRPVFPGRAQGRGAGWRWEREALEGALQCCQASARLGLRCQPPADLGQVEVTMLDAGRELLWLRRKLEGLSYLTAGKRSSRLRVAPESPSRRSAATACLLPRSLT